MTPLTASAPLICGDSNQSSSRSAMLMVSSRVTSPVVRTVMPRWLQASFARSSRSAGLLRADVRRHLGEQRAHHVGDALEPGVPLGPGVGVLLRPFGELLVGARGVVVVDRQRSALGERLVVRAHRVHLVAVPLQAQVAHDGRRHQAHHVRQPGDPQVRRVVPWRLGGGRTAERRAALQDQASWPPTGPRYAAETSPLWPPPMTMASYVFDMEDPPSSARTRVLTDCSI